MGGRVDDSGCGCGGEGNKRENERARHPERGRGVIQRTTKNEMRNSTYEMMKIGEVLRDCNFSFKSTYRENF
ncbi:predicted protein [Sclerotinia sclerotiorum 1980 UF-70]|uniref:Uncharacterized protein n=1 Tax=Sclerotinia sclerotiorum (strain ATCC 18683 / 1980 / Ss-1) TaxID=665079 RepID=A7EIS0_SCLS1|nr:predicted protein [Sclerotinia sclerotiorum 1980 UF-70]EDO02736.1 predicted protein [Sclerotinia sclerotiorum 1980 UF-70]